MIPEGRNGRYIVQIILFLLSLCSSNYENNWWHLRNNERHVDWFAATLCLCSTTGTRVKAAEEMAYELKFCNDHRIIVAMTWYHTRQVNHRGCGHQFGPTRRITVRDAWGKRVKVSLRDLYGKIRAIMGSGGARDFSIFFFLYHNFRTSKTCIHLFPNIYCAVSPVLHTRMAIIRMRRWYEKV